MSQQEEYYIENSGSYYRQEPTDSFLAGLLFCYKTIDYSDYIRLKIEFERKYEVEVVDREDLMVKLVAYGTTINLVDDYDDVLQVDGKYITVKYYLYSLTSKEVRDFLDLKEPKENSIKNYLRYIKKSLEQKKHGKRK